MGLGQVGNAGGILGSRPDFHSSHWPIHKRRPPGPVGNGVGRREGYADREIGVGAPPKVPGGERKSELSSKLEALSER